MIDFQIANFIVALTTPILLAKSSFAIYYLFGGCTLLTVLVCFFWMPETKGRSLESIDRSCAEHKRSIALQGLRLRRNTGLVATRQDALEGPHTVTALPVV